MFRRLLRCVMLGVATLVLSIGTGATTIAQTNPDCLGAEDYLHSMLTLQSAYRFSLGDISESQVNSWTADELQTGIEAATNLTAGLATLTPPPAAAEFHEGLSATFGLWLSVITAINESGMMAALPFLEEFSSAGESMSASAIAFEETCQIAYSDDDGDGIPEIGPGNQPAPITSAEIDPNAPVGSFQNPVPVGTPQDVGGGWEITVVDVRPDDTQAVLDENRFNAEPIAGRQFFVADVTVRNTGSEPAVFDGNFRLRATGLDGDYRAFAPDDRCGVVANEWEEPTIAPGESVTAAICWSIPATEVEAIRLYDVDAVTEARVYFALATPDPNA
ncbi:MAG: DUF4352 domain-containing protein [Thermomicrobiales bacterium]|nr:DUF4352 domain-containing protein [Thermomicrobiales bacterium]